MSTFDSAGDSSSHFDVIAPPSKGVATAMHAGQRFAIFMDVDNIGLQSKDAKNETVLQENTLGLILSHFTSKGMVLVGGYAYANWARFNALDHASKALSNYPM